MDPSNADSDSDGVDDGADSDPLDVGDEAVLLAQRTEAAVAVGRDRVAAAGMLAGEQGCDLIVTDGDLHVIGEGPDLVIHQPDAVLDAMGGRHAG